MKDKKIIAYKNERIKRIAFNLRGLLRDATMKEWSRLGKIKHNIYTMAKNIRVTPFSDFQAIYDLREKASVKCRSIENERSELHTALDNSICICSDCNQIDKDMCYNAYQEGWYCTQCVQSYRYFYAKEDLFGKAVNKDEVKKIESPVRKFVPWEKKRSFDYDKWRAQVRAYQASGNKTKELEYYDILEEEPSWNLSSDDFLRRGTLLVDTGKLEEAFEILNSLYGCEGHDAVVAPAQLQLARISAILGKEEKMLFYLKEAFRTTVFFERYERFFCYKTKELREAIKSVTAFESYRTNKKFQELVDFEWDKEDEIELKNKIKQYLEIKKVNLDSLHPIQLDLLEFLCKYPESEISLDFTIDKAWLTNSSNSVIIIKKSFINLPKEKKGMSRRANIEFSQGYLTRIQTLHIDEVTYDFEEGIFTQNVIEPVQKIIEGRVDVHIYENFLVFEPLSYERSPSDWRSYRVYDARRDNDYYAIAFSKPLENVAEFVGTNGTKELFTSAKNINSN